MTTSRWNSPPASDPSKVTRATVDVEKQRLKHFAMNDISNLDEKGQILAADDRRRFFAWQPAPATADSSFKATPAKHSAARPQCIPPSG